MSNDPEPELAPSADRLALVASELRGMGPHFRLTARAERWGPPRFESRFREVMHSAASAAEAIADDIDSLAADYPPQGEVAARPPEPDAGTSDRSPWTVGDLRALVDALPQELDCTPVLIEHGGHEAWVGSIDLERGLTLHAR